MSILKTMVFLLAVANIDLFLGTFDLKLILLTDETYAPWKRPSIKYVSAIFKSLTVLRF